MGRVQAKTQLPGPPAQCLGDRAWHAATALETLGHLSSRVVERLRL